MNTIIPDIKKIFAAKSHPQFQSGPEEEVLRSLFYQKHVQTTFWAQK